MDGDLILLKSIGILRITLLSGIAIDGSCEEINALGSFSRVRTTARLITISTLAMHIRRKNPLYNVKVYIDFVRYKLWSLDNVTLSGKAIFKVFYSTDFSVFFTVPFSYLSLS